MKVSNFSTWAVRKRGLAKTPHRAFRPQGLTLNPAGGTAILAGTFAHAPQHSHCAYLLDRLKPREPASNSSVVDREETDQNSLDLCLFTAS